MGYIVKKAREGAKAVCAAHGMDCAVAYSLTRRLWEEARAAILMAAGPRDWRMLPFHEKSRICERVVRALLDRDRLSGQKGHGLKARH